MRALPPPHPPGSIQWQRDSWMGHLDGTPSLGNRHLFWCVGASCAPSVQAGCGLFPSQGVKHSW